MLLLLLLLLGGIGAEGRGGDLGEGLGLLLTVGGDRGMQIHGISNKHRGWRRLLHL